MYVSATLKEEFGIAIIEAMASGLVVVAPAGGGPATYVEDGLTGVLVDTTRRGCPRRRRQVALDLAVDPASHRPRRRARAVLRERFGIDAMATALDGVYRQVTAASQDEDAGWRPSVPRGERPVTLLVISPDYASHLYPLATLATAWQDAGERVVVATGPATHDIVERFGYTREDLRLGRGSNPGVIRAEDQPRGEDDALRGFFDATRLGAVETLTFQARARRRGPSLGPRRHRPSRSSESWTASNRTT